MGGLGKVKVASVVVLLALGVAACGSKSTGNTSNQGKKGGGSDCAQANLAIGYVNSSFANRKIDGGDVNKFAIAGRDALRAFQNKLSGDISAAFNVVADTYNSFAEATKGVNYDPASGAKPPQAFTNALDAFKDPNYVQANLKVDEYLSQNC